MILDRILSVLTNVNNVLQVFEGFQQGSIILQPGKNVIEVVTRKEPIEVWVSLKNAGDMPVCNGNLDKITYTISTTGFVLYADVVSETLQVDWHALFEIEETKKNKKSKG